LESVQTHTFTQQNNNTVIPKMKLHVIGPVLTWSGTWCNI